jgi:hypothetical protein
MDSGQSRIRLPRGTIFPRIERRIDKTAEGKGL